mmetsp:Transcript_123507/g.349108  ORF Transcript_123507/g.349108 Transcript_123507/m.349108 type:complete len:485 (+) Transcript_123507:60-1514(+)
MHALCHLVAASFLTASVTRAFQDDGEAESLGAKAMDRRIHQDWGHVLLRSEIRLAPAGVKNSDANTIVWTDAAGIVFPPRSGRDLPQSSNTSTEHANGTGQPMQQPYPAVAKKSGGDLPQSSKASTEHAGGTGQPMQQHKADAPLRNEARLALPGGATRNVIEPNSKPWPGWQLADPKALQEQIKFFIMSFRQKRTEGYVDFIQPLLNSTDRVTNPQKAKFVLWCCYTEVSSARALAGLPSRAPDRPYLVWTSGLATKFDDPGLQLLIHRGDMMFIAFDLRDYYKLNDTTPPLPGVTMAPPRGLGKNTGVSRPKYFATFMGSENQCAGCSAMVRKDLKESYRDFRKTQTRADVFVRVGPSVVGEPSYTSTMNSTYVFLPHGHGRWSYRLSEAMQQCAIPVVLADGLTLPFEELISWDHIAVERPEALARDFHTLLRSLSTDERWIRERRERVCQAQEMYFMNQKLRSEALLRSAALWLRKHGRT